jgi:hypothetical protein
VDHETGTRDEQGQADSQLVEESKRARMKEVGIG